MPDALHNWEIQEMVDQMGLPELPEHTTDEDPEARDLIMYFEDADRGSVILIERVSLPDAIEYTNREDTHGDGWFVGRDYS